jgi:hypothetical protein
MWAKIYAEPTYSMGNGKAVVLDAAGDVLVASSTTQSFAGGGIRVIKYAKLTGNLLWVNAFDGPDGADEARGLAIDQSGDPIVTDIRPREHLNSRFLLGRSTALLDRRFGLVLTTVWL